MAATTVDPTPNAGGARPAAKAKTEAAVPAPPRMFWRAVVRAGGQVAASRERDRVAWHLAACIAPQAEGSHCTEGRHLIETTNVAFDDFARAESDVTRNRDLLGLG